MIDPSKHVDTLLGALSLVEVDSVVEGAENAGDLLVREEAGKGEAGVVVDGDVEAFDAGARIAEGAIAGGADAGPREAAQFLDVEMKEFARVSTLVTLWRRFGRLEGGEAMEAVAAQDPGDGSLGDLKNGEDLGVGAALAAQSEDVSFEFGAGPARLKDRDGGAIVKLRWKAGFFGALKPAADGPFANVISARDLTQGKALRTEMRDHFSSHSGGESGISVHVVRAGFGWGLS